MNSKCFDEFSIGSIGDFWNLPTRMKGKPKETIELEIVSKMFFALMSVKETLYMD